MKLLLCFALVVQLTFVFAHSLPSEKSDNALVEPLTNIFSNHIPQYLEPLNLSPGELKVFTGHSFQLIQAKCPAVSQERLALIQKYISKLISKNNPEPAGSSTTFTTLISAVTNCTQHQITDEERAERTSGLLSFFLRPFKSLKSLFDSAPSDPAQDSLDASTEPSNAAAPDTLPLDTDAKPEPVQVINKKDDRAASAFDDEEDISNSPFSSTVSPDTMQVDDAGPASPFIRIFYTTNDSGPFLNPFGWLGGVFQSIRNFFSSFLNGFTGDDEASTAQASATSPTPLSRKKRDAEQQKQPLELVALNVPEPASLLDSKALDEQDLKEPEVTTPVAHTISGKEAFMVLVDNMCRIYCDECLAQDQIKNFKAASKELFQLIMTDETGMELAAKHFLEPEFLDAINAC